MRRVKRRRIKALCHFTPLYNAESIMAHGLVSRNILIDDGIQFFAPDKLRLDGHFNAVSLSVESINESMFSAKRREYNCNWVIFVVNPSVIWTHECRFCWKNAATSEICNHRGFIGGPWAFDKMFEDRCVHPSESYRASRNRLDYQPTDNAAEIQVLEPIAPELIIGAFTGREAVKSEMLRVMKNIGITKPVHVDDTLFL